MRWKAHLAPSIAISLFMIAFVLAAFGPPANAKSAELTRSQVEAALPKLDKLAADVIKRGDVPGMAIGVVFNDQVLYLKGFGVRQLGEPDAVDPDTVFQLASLSKPLASTAVASLVGEGIVSWDSKIIDLDPSFRLYDPYATAQVTLRDLFSHRSGLAGDAGNDLEGLGFSQAEILRRVRYLPPAGPFRSTYSYSNFGITEGGVAAAKASGMAWEDLIATRIFKPLGMTSTSARYADFVARPDHASLHAFIDGKWQPVVKRNPDAQSPAGGVSSTVRDLANWVILQMDGGEFQGKQLIDPTALAETHKLLIQSGGNPVTKQPTYYGLGWGTDVEANGLHWRHSGAFSAGARTSVDIMPDQHLGIIVLANAFPSGVPEGLTDAFYDYVFDGKQSQDWVSKWTDIFGTAFYGEFLDSAIAQYANAPTPHTQALPLSAYTGIYSNDYFGQVVISEKDGRLVLALGPDGKTVFPLTHFDRDTFLYYPSEEAPNYPLPVQFTPGPALKATQVTISGVNDSGQGVMKRVNK